MNSIIEKLYENEKNAISYKDLSNVIKELLSSVKNSEIIEVDSMVVSFGTFLEMMRRDPSVAEQWLSTMNNTFSELQLNSYRTYQTINSTPQKKDSSLCFSCFSSLSFFNNNLVENGEIYRYPFHKKNLYIYIPKLYI